MSYDFKIQTLEKIISQKQRDLNELTLDAKRSIHLRDQAALDYQAMQEDMKFREKKREDFIK